MGSGIFSDWAGRITCMCVQYICIYIHSNYWIYILNCDDIEFTELLALNLCTTYDGLFIYVCILLTIICIYVYISQVVYKFSAILMENNICVKRGLLDCILCRVSCWEPPKTVSLCDWGWGAFLRCIKITRILQDKNGAVWQKRITELSQLIRLEKTLALQKITVWERLDCISLRQGDALAWYFSMSGDFKENRLELSRWKI